MRCLLVVACFVTIVVCRLLFVACPCPLRVVVVVCTLLLFGACCVLFETRCCASVVVRCLLLVVNCGSL